MFPQKRKLGASIGSDPSTMPPKYKPSAGQDISAENDAQEPKPEPSQEGAAPTATPESVNFRTAAETCANCEYMQGENCTFLNQPVAAGDSCNRFESKSEDMGGDEAGGGASELGNPGGY